MVKHQIFINTSSKHFCEWLRKTTSEYHMDEYPTDNGYFCIGRAEYKNTYFETIKKMTIYGYYVYPKTGETQICLEHENLIEVNIQELDVNRTEVTFISYAKAITGYIEELINEIDRLWPKSLSSVENRGNAGILSKISNEQMIMQEKLDKILSGVGNNLYETNEINTMIQSIEQAIQVLLQNDVINLSPDDKRQILEQQREIILTPNIQGKLIATFTLIPYLLKYEVEIGNFPGINIKELIEKFHLKTKENGAIEIPKENKSRN